MARKTVNVNDVREHCNLMLSLVDRPAASPSAPQFNKEFRRGVMAVVERVLMDTDNYRGFNYLDSEFLPSVNGEPRALREDYDPTRVRYY